jgi:hypothetical protein
VSPGVLTGFRRETAGDPPGIPNRGS